MRTLLGKLLIKSIYIITKYNYAKRGVVTKLIARDIGPDIGAQEETNFSQAHGHTPIVKTECRFLEVDK